MESTQPFGSASETRTADFYHLKGHSTRLGLVQTVLTHPLTRYPLELVSDQSAENPVKGSHTRRLISTESQRPRHLRAVVTSPLTDRVQTPCSAHHRADCQRQDGYSIGCLRPYLLRGSGTLSNASRNVMASVTIHLSFDNDRTLYQRMKRPCVTSRGKHILTVIGCRTSKAALCGS